jgi:hypothetical protein
MLCFDCFSVEAIRSSIETDGRHSTIDCQDDDPKQIFE